MRKNQLKKFEKQNYAFEKMDDKKVKAKTCIFFAKNLLHCIKILSKNFKDITENDFFAPRIRTLELIFFTSGYTQNHYYETWLRNTNSKRKKHQRG